MLADFFCKTYHEFCNLICLCHFFSVTSEICCLFKYVWMYLYVLFVIEWSSSAFDPRSKRSTQFFFQKAKWFFFNFIFFFGNNERNFSLGK